MRASASLLLLSLALVGCSSAAPDADFIASPGYPIPETETFISPVDVPADKLWSLDEPWIGYATEPLAVIRATADGRVVLDGTNKALGNYLVVAHRYKGSTVYSVYAHLAPRTYKRARLYQEVKQGDFLAPAATSVEEDRPLFRFQIDLDTRETDPHLPEYDGLFTMDPAELPGFTLHP